MEGALPGLSSIPPDLQITLHNVARIEGSSTDSVLVADTQSDGFRRIAANSGAEHISSEPYSPARRAEHISHLPTPQR